MSLQVTRWREVAPVLRARWGTQSYPGAVGATEDAQELLLPSRRQESVQGSGEAGEVRAVLRECPCLR